MLILEHINKRFRNGFVALEDINLQVHPSEIISLVGTSGCGKSTLLRIIAGLDRPTSGQVVINHQVVNAPHPEIGIIFQEPRLMPWLTVQQNIRFGLSAADRDRDPAGILAKVGLSEFAQALPRQLSGGMAQRVAIARALITQPEILLLDEPFSALDAFTRTQLQDHLLQIWHYDRPTLILVTHDVEEALVLSDRILVLRGNPGRVHRELKVDLPRPRQRTDYALQRWKEKLLSELDLSLPSASPAADWREPLVPASPSHSPFH